MSLVVKYSNQSRYSSSKSSIGSFFTDGEAEVEVVVVVVVVVFVVVVVVLLVVMVVVVVVEGAVVELEINGIVGFRDLVVYHCHCHQSNGPAGEYQGVGNGVVVFADGADVSVELTIGGTVVVETVVFDGRDLAALLLLIKTQGV